MKGHHQDRLLASGRAGDITDEHVIASSIVALARLLDGERHRAAAPAGVGGRGPLFRVGRGGAGCVGGGSDSTHNRLRGTDERPSQRGH